MDITRKYEDKQRRDKCNRIMNSTVCMWTGIMMCPLLLILGGIVNISSNITDRIRDIRRKKKINKRKIHPKKKGK